MKGVFAIFLIPSVAIIINSCGKEDPFFEVDNTAPVIAEVTAVTTPTNDNTPNYTFSSTESGSIAFEGPCSSSTTSADEGTNTITLSSLSDGTYIDCAITVTDKAANESNLLTLTSFLVDSTASTLVETTAIPSSTNDSTPDYTFISSEAGTITYGGSCSSSTTLAIAGTNTITFSSLSDGTYSDCKITITDSFGNSVTLSISSFVIDTTPPTVASVSPEDNSTDVAVSTTVAVTFSETMSTSTITTNTDNTTCYGSFQLSSDNFTTCIKMSAAPSASNSYKTYTVTPDDNLSRVTNYKIQITSSAADNLSHSLADNYTTSNGFTTYSAGTIQGTVKQSNGSALSDVLVSFSGANTDNATTDNSGNFNKTLGLGSYTLTYTKSGYISSTQSATLATDNQTVVVATLTLLSSSSCSAGNISGTIKDAVSGSAISGVSISIRSGANVTSGSTISGKTDTTDSDGLYELTSVPAGVYTGEASKSGYITSYFNVNVCGNVSNQDSNMSTTLNSETMRIVTSWKGTDDLDSHLEIPVSDAQDGDSDKTDSTHLFYGTTQDNSISYSGISTRDYHLYTDIVSAGDNVTLDQDNTDGSGSPCGNGCGPETITISKIRSGTYRYHVHNFSRKGNTNNSKLAESEATVQVFYDNNSTIFYVPSSAGNLWTVFDFDNSSGFNPLNTVADESDPKKVDDH